MMLCPSGHNSTTTDFCDVCGVPLDEASSPVASRMPVTPTEPCPSCGTSRTGRFCEECGHDFAGMMRRPQPQPDEQPREQPPGQPARPPAEQLPVQLQPAEPRTGQPAGPPAELPDEQRSGPPATESGAGPPATAQPVGQPQWVAVVTADPYYYQTVIAAGGQDAASITLPANCPERRFLLAGPQVRLGRRSVSRRLHPEIDLSGPPEDPGVSHLHAVLLAQPDGTWAILDLGSTNGTTINDDPEPLRAGVTVPLTDGDRIHLGAWTTITVRAPTN